MDFLLAWFGATVRTWPEMVSPILKGMQPTVRFTDELFVVPHKREKYTLMTSRLCQVLIGNRQSASAALGTCGVLQ